MSLRRAVEQIILVSRDLTRRNGVKCTDYEIGDVIRFTARQRAVWHSRRAAYAQQSRRPIAKLNRLIVQTADGRRIDYNPRRLSGVDAFRREQRISRQGRSDPVPRSRPRTWRRERGIRHCRSDRRPQSPLRLDGGREVKAAVSPKTPPHRLRLRLDFAFKPRHTVDRVIVNVDTNRSAELVNRKQFYVSISRARHGVSLYTDDSAALRHAVGRTREKSIALERLKLNVGRDLKMVPEPPRQNITPAHGIRR